MTASGFGAVLHECCFGFTVLVDLVLLVLVTLFAFSFQDLLLLFVFVCVLCVIWLFGFVGLVFCFVLCFALLC